MPIWIIVSLIASLLGLPKPVLVEHEQSHTWQEWDYVIEGGYVKVERFANGEGQHVLQINVVY